MPLFITAFFITLLLHCTTALAIEAQKLSLSGALTPSGAERAGNADGSIPAWSGHDDHLSRQVHHVSGNAYPDIYRREKALVDIHAHNMQKHIQYLSPGLQALLHAYPESFFIPVYPSHREHSFAQHIIARNAWNAQHTIISSDGERISHYSGAVPFPLPETAEQVIWNARLNHPNAVLNGILDDIGVYSNEQRHLSRQAFTSEYPFANPLNAPGTSEADIGDQIARIMVDVIKPEHDKGSKTLVHEFLNGDSSDRKAWVYTTRTKRVRRAPELGANLPYGPGGFATLDDLLGFNGSIGRYHWTLLGKHEMYIPYNAYAFDRQGLDYFELLMQHHANPEYMRYEKHRVWVVEAQLKSGEKHSYAKRRFYIDEDSWQIALLESYDHDDQIWRVGILNTVYDFSLKGHVARAQMIHDLKAKAYVSMRMVNEKGQPRLQGTIQGAAYFSPGNLPKRTL